MGNNNVPRCRGADSRERLYHAVATDGGTDSLLDVPEIVVYTLVYTRKGWGHEYSEGFP